MKHKQKVLDHLSTIQRSADSIRRMAEEYKVTQNPQNLEEILGQTNLVVKTIGYAENLVDINPDEF
tara:strand:+ start:110 stop:307 length:198 start_codon:yes stop_codon:yes gene_type:complete